jgi:hypothetical protein
LIRLFAPQKGETKLRLKQAKWPLWAFTPWACGFFFLKTVNDRVAANAKGKSVHVESSGIVGDGEGAVVGVKAKARLRRLF